MRGAAMLRVVLEIDSEQGAIWSPVTLDRVCVVKCEDLSDRDPALIDIPPMRLLIARPNKLTASSLVIASWLFFSFAMSGRVQAGLSAENVILVVNGDSRDSVTLANHYLELRGIPDNHVVVLDEIPSGLTISLDDFRDLILRPLLKEIDRRGLANQTRVIAYSAGFPTSVDIKTHTSRLTAAMQKRYQKPTASLNSLTFFFRWVLADSPDYLGWGSNFYCRGPFKRNFANPFGGEKREEFDVATQLVTEEKYAEAAQAWCDLAEQYPTIASLRIRAAEAYAHAGKSNEATEQVRLAIQSGWTDRRYVVETAPLSELFAESDDDSKPLPRSRERLLELLVDRPNTMQSPVGFVSDSGWTISGDRQPAKQGAMTYLLSCMLGVIHPRGSTMEQAVEVLRRGKQADATYPDATFGFSKTSDVRSTTRQPGMVDSLAWLLSQDRKVDVFSSRLPKGDQQYVGMMLGAASLPLDDRTWSFVPGAITDNLTSLGGAFGSSSQTKLTALLHAGAVMSSGAVAEPYSLQPKFPHPIMYAYYQEGVTAIEAFYLAVASPYQLLIVGDPLCQPYAKPIVDFVRIESTAAVANSDAASGGTKLRFVWQAMPRSPSSIATKAIELFMQGKLVGSVRPVNKVEINLPPNMRGVMSCRATLVGRHATEPRVVFAETIVLGDEAELPKLERLRKSDQQSFHVSADCAGADRIEVRHMGRVVATVDGSSGEIELSEDQLGRGPIALSSVAWFGKEAVTGRVLKSSW